MAISMPRDSCTSSSSRCSYFFSNTLSTAYFGIILSAVIFFGWKIFKRSKQRKLEDMDLLGGLKEIDEDEAWWKEHYIPPTTLWGKFVEWLL